MKQGENLLYHSIMLSSITLIQDELNSSAIIFSCQFHLPHMKESILILHFTILITKGGNDYINATERHVFVQMKRGSSMHH